MKGNRNSRPGDIVSPVPVRNESDLPWGKVGGADRWPVTGAVALTRGESSRGIGARSPCYE